MANNLEYKSQGFSDGLAAGFNDPIRFRDIPEIIGQIPEQIKDIINKPDSKEYSRSSVLGTLTGHLINPTFILAYASTGALGYILYNYLN